MATVDTGLERLVPEGEASHELATSWRRLTRAATVVVVLTAPALYVWFTKQNGWDWWVALLATIGVIAIFRGLADLIFRRVIPRPSLFGLDSKQLQEEDVVARRRAWFWRFWFRIGAFLIVVNTIVWLFQGGTWGVQQGRSSRGSGTSSRIRCCWTQVIFVFFLFIANFGILFGPLLLMNLTQIKAFEPGDAQWGVKLEDVRGQKEAKEEIRRVVFDLAIRRAVRAAPAGSASAASSSTGRRAPARRCWRRRSRPASTRRSSPSPALASQRRSSGSTRSSSAIWHWKAKQRRAQVGRPVIVFIDEIDAVGCAGRRSARAAASAAQTPLPPQNLEQLQFYGPLGGLQPVRRPRARDAALARPDLRRARRSNA